MVERSGKGGRGCEPARVRQRLDQSAPGDRAEPAVRWREVVGHRRRERTVGPPRLHRDPGCERREELTQRTKTSSFRSIVIGRELLAVPARCAKLTIRIGWGSIRLGGSID